MRVARLRPVVRTIAMVSLVVGMAGEAFDRLWTVRVLESFSLPDVAGLDGEVVWFTAIALAGTLVSLVVSLVVNRAAPRLVGAEHPTWLLASLVGLQVVFVLAVALGGSLWLVLAALWGRGAAGALAAPIRSAWLNRNLSSGHPRDRHLDDLAARRRRSGRRRSTARCARQPDLHVHGPRRERRGAHPGRPPVCPAAAGPTRLVRRGEGR